MDQVLDPGVSGSGKVNAQTITHFPTVATKITTLEIDQLLGYDHYLIGIRQRQQEF